jgi:hypothetical protein
MHRRSIHPYRNPQPHGTACDVGRTLGECTGYLEFLQKGLCTVGPVPKSQVRGRLSE